MPYPLAKLPYGLRCRLSDVATPLERYNLQIAAGGPAICPPDVQILQTTTYDWLICNNGTLTIENNFGSLVFSSTDLLSCTHFLMMKNMCLLDLTNPSLSHVLLRPKRLRLTQCQTSKTFIKTLSRLTEKSLSSIDLSESTNDSLNLTDVFLAFPQLEAFNAYGIILTPTWMSDILKTQKIKLSRLNIEGSAKQLGDFTVYDLASFIEAQEEAFLLTIKVGANTKVDARESMLYAEKLQRFLGQLPRTLQCRFQVLRKHSMLCC
uniref:Recep_L_domain domain-containing protein n=1 Tax=Panagrellus redivivus TaxID=6233 RepID=A0A7E4V2A0_PANRE